MVDVYHAREKTEEEVEEEKEEDVEEGIAITKVDIPIIIRSSLASSPH